MSNATPKPAQRDGFTSSFGVIAATLGSAVGLGNIWKFPYLTGANGGASFLLVYLLATLLIGLPIMIAELTLGRAAKADAITTFVKLAPRRSAWWVIGLLGVICAYLIMGFYSEVAGWVFAYIFKSADGSLLSSSPQATGAAFDALIHNPWQALLWQWLVLLVIGGVLIIGVSKGIEAVTKKLMPILFVLLVIIAVRSLTLPGAAEGLSFLFSPDFSKIDAGVILTAMGLAFFKLSIGMGTMLTYGSYFRDDQNIPATALRVMTADLFVSMLAGIAIFPAVF
ncbi:MAG: sodium-dependent transporter, partial [Shewanella sp.]